MPEESPPREAVTGLPVEYLSPAASVHTNCLHVQADDCMYLHFFQIRPPMVSSPGQAPSVVAEPVASVAVSFDRLQEFINVMQQQLNLVKMAMAATPTGGKYTFLDSSGHWCTEDNEVVSGADLAMEDFDVTERDAEEVRRAIASRQARPRYPLPDNWIGVQ